MSAPAKTATPSVPAPQTATPRSTPPVHVLRIWLPPQFDPNTETPAAKLLKARLDAFVSKHPGLLLDIRIKGMDTGPSLLETLSLTRSAAPDALPDLVALPRPDLESAAIKGIVHPLDGLTTLLDDPDWYSYAREMGHIQNSVYGLPFAGDTLALVYHPSQFAQSPSSWSDLFAQKGSLAVYGDDPNSLLQFDLYLSTGSPLLDDANHATLDEVALTRILQELDKANLVTLQNEDAVWNAFVDGRVNMAVVWTSRFIREPRADSALLPLPGLEETPFTLASGWAWSLAGADPQNESLASELAEWLVADDYLVQWDQAAGYLSPRPNAMKAWDSQGKLDAISQSAQLVPSNDLLSALGPSLQQALSRILNGEQVDGVVRSVIESLK